MVAVRRFQEKIRLGEFIPLTERVRTVITELASVLENEQDRKDLLEMQEKIEKIAEHFEDLKEEESPGVIWEKTMILVAAVVAGKKEHWSRDDVFAILRQFYKLKKEPRSESARREEELFINIRGLALRQLLIESGVKIITLTNQETAVLQERFASDPQKMINAIASAEFRKTIRAMIETRQYTRVEGEVAVIRLPLTQRQAQMAIRTGYQSLEQVFGPVFRATSYFTTLIDGRPIRVALLFKDTSKITEAHEKLHISFPGLRLSGRRVSLDEAITNHLAEKVAGEQATSYRSEAALLEFLGEDILELLVKRYKKDSTKNSKELAIAMINKFGFLGFVRSFQATPDYGEGSRDFPSEGKVKTLDAQQELERKTKKGGSGFYAKLRSFWQ